MRQAMKLRPSFTGLPTQAVAHSNVQVFLDHPHLVWICFFPFWVARAREGGSARTGTTEVSFLNFQIEHAAEG